MPRQISYGKYFAHVLREAVVAYDEVLREDNTGEPEHELWMEFNNIERPVDMDWSIKRDGKQVNITLKIEVTTEASQLQQLQCPNCGELITHTADRLDCQYCGYGCDYPYDDEE